MSHPGTALIGDEHLPHVLWTKVQAYLPLQFRQFRPTIVTAATAAKLRPGDEQYIHLTELRLDIIHITDNLARYPRLQKLSTCKCPTSIPSLRHLQQLKHFALRHCFTVTKNSNWNASLLGPKPSTAGAPAADLQALPNLQYLSAKFLNYPTHTRSPNHFPALRSILIGRLDDAIAFQSLERLVILDECGPNIFANISQCTNLEHLEIDANNTKSLSGIECLTKLKVLKLMGQYRHSIPNVNPLGALTKLVHVDIWAQIGGSLAPLQYCTSLRHLSMGSHIGGDMGALRGLTSLTYLDLRNANSSGAEVIGQFPLLTTLCLGQVGLSVLEQAASLKYLTTLNIMKPKDPNDLKALRPILDRPGGCFTMASTHPHSDGTSCPRVITPIAGHVPK